MHFSKRAFYFTLYLTDCEHIKKQSCVRLTTNYLQQYVYDMRYTYVTIIIVTYKNVSVGTVVL